MSPDHCYFCSAVIDGRTAALLQTSKDHIHACADCAARAVGVAFVRLRAAE